MKIKYRIALFIMLLGGMSISSKGQDGITLQELREAAVLNYPLTAQRELIAQSMAFSLSNANRGYLPQFSVSAKATYQTDVTKIPFKIPGYEIANVPQDQYQMSVDLNQTIWDGGIIRAQKRSIRAGAATQGAQLEVELYTLRERVDNLFFGILLLDGRLQQNDLYEQTLARNYDKVRSYIALGVATATDLDAVSVEQLVNSQNRAEIVATRGAYLEMLRQMTGVDLSSAVGALVVPAMPEDLTDSIADSRPEFKLFDAQRSALDAQHTILKSGNTPRIGLFAKGAYGNPGLNMLKGGFQPYAIGGVQLSWNIGSFYTFSSEVHKLKLQSRMIETQKRAFVYNTRLSVAQNGGEVVKLQSQIQDDDRIIELRTRIREAAEASVASGTMTVPDMLDDLTDENNAKVNMLLHRMQLLMTAYKITNMTNK